MLIFTGSLAVSYGRSRFCLCGEKFSFIHFTQCSLLGPHLLPSLQLAVERDDWQGVVVPLILPFQVYLHAARNGDIRDEEAELFSLLDDLVADNSPTLDDNQLFL
jgi:hypothetical protein